VQQRIDLRDSNLRAVATRQARCSCGQLRAEVAGDPVRVSVCHCLACQQRTGSAFGFQARWPRESVRVTGESREFMRVSDDGEEERRFYFCPQCGATVYYVTDPEFVAIPVGVLADPGFPEPTVSVWETRRHAWVSLPADCRRYD
jgi:hypothetical protein